MSELSRRTVLRSAGVGAVAVAGTQWWAGTAAAHTDFPAPRTGDNPVVRENGAPGSGRWAVGCDDTCGVDLARPQIQGYASRNSVGHGELIGFHIASSVAQSCTVAVYRTGHYAGVQARHLLTSGDLAVGPRTGGKAAWKPTVPQDWVSGVFMAVFTSADGHRAFTPFVVREPARRSDLLLVLPFAKTPDRPYPGIGLPEDFDTDCSTARWLEEEGYDVTYATEEDLHEGHVDPARYTAVVLPGADRDARWSRKTRAAVGRATGAGTRLARLHRPLALHEPGHIDEDARRAATDVLTRVLEPRVR
ncbi:N,N-dimethylformamidase beta subunit family domain-containing protein [Streptomyces sp. NPDC006551]|uniref:N,N-dimethylformamidase beta subunit family domain-containing protein n=1 Tax=Streptomyces sp. NPDC006551 TaxID=3157178 RepID=UPI0033ADF662